MVKLYIKHRAPLDPLAEQLDEDGAESVDVLAGYRFVSATGNTPLVDKRPSGGGRRHMATRVPGEGSPQGGARGYGHRDGRQ